MNNPSTKLITLSFTFFLSIASVFADEGMWMLDQLKELDWKKLQERGMEISPSDIQKMSDAVVIIGGGSGAFISSSGLVLTNHHVAHSAIQRVSTQEMNYLEGGFLAKSKEEELSVPGYEVKITRKHKDVTKEVLSAIKNDMSPLERLQAIGRKKQEIEKKASKEGEIEAVVVGVYSGMKYYLYEYETFKDVRLVYAPPGSIGKFGGDIDNWMWPRHTGDFAIFRVYANKDNKPTEHSEKNWVYSPDSFLHISKEGIKDGDITFALGYPGKTYRYRTSYSIAYHQNVYYPYRIEMFSIWLDLIKKASRENEEVALKLANWDSRVNNSMKNNRGMIDGFKKLDLINKKKLMEAEFRIFVNSNPKMEEKYGNVLTKIDNAYKDVYTYAEKYNWMSSLKYVQLPAAVISAYRFAMEKQKPFNEREPEYSEKKKEDNLKKLRLAVQNHVPSFDKAQADGFLLKISGLTGAQKVEFIHKIVGNSNGTELQKKIHEFVDNMFTESKIQTLEDAINLYDKSFSDMEDMRDPMIKFAKQYLEKFIPLETKYREFSEVVSGLRSDYIRALFEWKKEDLYADANRTIRFTFGDVSGYSPADAVKYSPITYLKGVIDKDTGKEPFAVPSKLRDLCKNRDFGSYADPTAGDVPVDFLHSVDTTGGNSGSPAFNGRGELVGVLFDGNYEAMTADYQYDPEITRSMSVDARYILFIMDKFSGAKYLIDEMNTAL
jgi:hypothetical protein